MDDRQILAQFLSRSEDAITAASARYGSYCRYIAMQILHDEQDAAEVVNDVLLKAWNTIPPQEPASLRSYLGMLARQLSIDRWRGRPGEFAQSLDELQEIARGEQLSDDLALRDALNDFVGSLGKTNRRIFLQRYWFACSIAEIAAQSGLSEGSVKMRLKRMREALAKKCEGKELL